MEPGCCQGLILKIKMWSLFLIMKNFLFYSKCLCFWGRLWCFSLLICILWWYLFSFPASPSVFLSSSLTQTNSLHQGSRRRQKGSDYTSTSDEEYDSNKSTPKNKRSQPSSAFHSARNQPRSQPVVALHPKPSGKDSEGDKREGETLHGWSNHSAEIAR